MHGCPVGGLIPLVVQTDLITFISLFTNKINTKYIDELKLVNGLI